MSKQAKTISRRVLEDLFSAGRLDAADELFAPDFVDHLPPSQGPDLHGPEGEKRFAQEYRQAFPDLRITIDDQISEGDKVVTRWTARGTHTGELAGIPPTGNQITVSGATIDRIAHGKIVETWDLWDTLGMLQQLGVPAPMLH